MEALIWLTILFVFFLLLYLPLGLAEVKKWRRKNYIKVAIKRFPEIAEDFDNYRISIYRNEAIKVEKLTPYLKSLYIQLGELEDKLGEFLDKLNDTEASIDNGNPFEEELKITISEIKRLIDVAENKIVNYEIDNPNLIRYIDL